MLLCLVFLATPALAAEPVYGVNGTQERVITLPQDQGQWYVSVFGNLTDTKYKQVKEWFRSHPGLINLRGQVHYNEYIENGPRYQRYAKTMPGLPCIRVQNSKGKVISEFWGEYIPLSSASLYRGICKDMSKVKAVKTGGPLRCLKRKCCPNRNPPEPEPTPEPTPTTDTPPVVDTPPVTQGSFPWLLLGLSIVTGGGIGVAQGYREQHYPKPKSLKVS
jgi:hypothetical protein